MQSIMLCFWYSVEPTSPRRHSHAVHFRQSSCLRFDGERRWSDRGNRGRHASSPVLIKSAQQVPIRDHLLATGTVGKEIGLLLQAGYLARRHPRRVATDAAVCMLLLLLLLLRIVVVVWLLLLLLLLHLRLHVLLLRMLGLHVLWLVMAEHPLLKLLLLLLLVHVRLLLLQLLLLLMVELLHPHLLLLLLLLAGMLLLVLLMRVVIVLHREGLLLVPATTTTTTSTAREARGTGRQAAGQAAGVGERGESLDRIAGRQGGGERRGRRGHDASATVAAVQE